MTNEEIVEELNTLLRGNYMGIRSLEHYIQKTENTSLKKDFQSIQKDAKENAQLLAERIQNSGGVPASGEGFTGSIHSYMHKLMTPDEPSELVDDAIKGMDKYGVEYSEELVKGNLDSETKQVVEKVIDSNRRNAKKLKRIMQ